MAVRAALIHVIGDLLQNIGVMIAAGLIWHDPKWTVADPICTFIFAVLVLATTPGILMQGFRILLNAGPEEDVRREGRSLVEPSVLNVHNLHVWPLDSSGRLSLIHVVCGLETGAT